MIEFIDEKLYFDGCNTVELAKKYQTPLYLVSENSIVDRCKEINDIFLNKYENSKAIFASKAFLPMAMCKIIAREGLGLDVVSGGELYTAIKADFPMDRIDFSGNNKSKDELILAVKNQIGRVVVDNAYELHLLEEVCEELGKPMSILIRIIPGVESNTHDYITTGNKDSKFGIPTSKSIIYPVIDFATNSKWIDFKGFHFHVGSQLFDIDSHMSAIENALSLIKELYKDKNLLITELDIGGGFGIQYMPEDKPLDLSGFIDPAMKRIDTFFNENNLIRPKIVIEPGRWIIGNAGITLYSVGSIKKTETGRKYVAVDGGMSDNIRPALYQAKYHALLANRVDDLSKETITIAGKFCESSDILIKDIDLPVLTSGDLIAVLATGAYNYSMVSNYNKNIIPAVVLLNNGDDSVIVKRQSYEDIIRNELIPERLRG